MDRFWEMFVSKIFWPPILWLSLGFWTGQNIAAVVRAMYVRALLEAKQQLCWRNWKSIMAACHDFVCVFVDDLWILVKKIITTLFHCWPMYTFYKFGVLLVLITGILGHNCISSFVPKKKGTPVGLHFKLRKDLGLSQSAQQLLEEFEATLKPRERRSKDTGWFGGFLK